MTTTNLRNIVWGTGSALLIVGAIAYSSQASSGSGDPAKRGEYLVNAAVCHDCHTPWKMGANGPEPDMTRMLSGHPETVSVTKAPALGVGSWTWAGSSTNTAFAGPWGLSYAFNLTPDPNTGLGIWTEDMFVKAIKTGRHMGVSRPIAPPMPWKMFRNFSDEDLKAIYAYLRTIPPIVNHVPEYTPPAGSTTSDAADGQR